MNLDLQNIPDFDRSDFSDKLTQRIMDCWLDELATPLDLAVLLRQWMRREMLQKEGTVVSFLASPEVVNKIEDVAAQSGINIHHGAQGNPILSVNAWEPEWVRGSSKSHPVDFCSGEDQRRAMGQIPADGSFKRLGYETFKTNGQFAAVQAVRAMSEGSTCVIMLPTGSGKTEVALALIEDLPLEFKILESPTIMSVIIVPYVVLAKDLERRLLNLYKDRLYSSDIPLLFAHTHDMSDDQKQTVIDRIENGEDEIPGILITSPESLVGKFRDLVLDKARRGQLGAIVVDEAHLLYQSGVDFRLDFREVSKLRAEACEVALAAGHRRPKTLLMSATIGDTELRHFAETFGPTEQLGVIDAIEARDEPDIFIAQRCPPDERLEHLKEAISRLPRPALVYVTKPDDAKELFRVMREWGFGRTRCVVAETPGSERTATLRDLRTDDGSSKVDLVIANSAFGLGIDCDEIRTVIHYCLPETIDRWYQEIGRGGRDGNRSVGLLLPDLEKRSKGSDYRVAVSLSPTTLEVQTIKDRWQHLQTNGLELKVEGENAVGVFLNLRTKNPNTKKKKETSSTQHSDSGYSYDLKWNRTILYALQEFGLLTLSSPTENAWAAIREVSDHWDWVQVEYHKGAELDDLFMNWWEEFRKRTHEPFKKQINLMWEVASGNESPCVAIEKTYEFGNDLIKRFSPSLQVDRCSSDCGHCSSCFEAGISPTPQSLLSPNISVPLGNSDNQLLLQLHQFWSEVPTWNQLTGPRVQLYPVFLDDIESDRMRTLLRSHVPNLRGWYHGGSEIARKKTLDGTQGTESPMWSVIDATGLNVTIDLSFRSHKFRHDLPVPPLILLLDKNFEQVKFTTKDSNLLDWKTASLARWKSKTQGIMANWLKAIQR
jgi:superfamily II DNA or RNA helicase